MTEWAEEVPRRLRLIKPLVIPLAAALVVAVVGAWTLSVLDRSVKARVAGTLTFAVDANVTALNGWVDAKEAVAEVVAADPRVAALAETIQQRSQRGDLPADALRRLPEAARFRELMAGFASNQDFAGYGMLDRDGRVLAAYSDSLVGLRVSLSVRDALSEVAAGETVTAGAVLLPAPADPAGRGGRAVMLIAAPLRDPRGSVIGVLAFPLHLSGDFTRILGVGRFGKTGESYAFNADGLMLSESRFDDQLRRMGLLPPDTAVGSALRIVLRDPGKDPRRGLSPQAPDARAPLTQMAQSATAGHDSLDVEGYRDYRGVKVVGAWRWLPHYGFGVATELDYAEAFLPMRLLRRAFGVLLGLLLLSAAGMLVYSLVVERLRRRIRKATRLGRYTLTEKIGEGGMGVVYRARHAMLRRPTAVKLIREGEVTPEALARFEREVQTTSRLTNPNTVAIYDYGRTPEGVFYYAMEYLDGLTLDRVVAQYGPQPEARIVGILSQACGSLAEAHAEGLIHRDIKPSNLMICARGGRYDVVKVLDFGLVKQVSQPTDQNVTAADAVTGTPNYMSPEQINAAKKVDARSDLYGLGAVAYFLVTGEPVFDGRSIIEIMGHHLYKPPVPPSQRLGRKVDSRLEAIIMQCLVKDPNQRPPNAGALYDLLAQGLDPGTPPWTPEMAQSWWQLEAARRPAEAPTHLESSQRPEIEVDLSARVGG